MMIEQIKRAVEAAHGHFFEPATMRFFRSRVHSPVYSSGQSGQASPHYFVTSEEFKDFRGRSHGEFQQYASRSAAHKAAWRAAEVVAS